MTVPQILFVCVHNAGRSQMAEAILRSEAQARGIEVVSASAGTLGAGELNPVCVQALEEIGISMQHQFPKILTNEMVESATRIVSMGCGVDAEACPAKFIVSEDWGLDDPKGQGIDAVRRIRDQIKSRVEALLMELVVVTP